MPSVWRYVLTVEVEGDTTRAHDRLAQAVDDAENHGGSVVSTAVERVASPEQHAVPNQHAVPVDTNVILIPRNADPSAVAAAKRVLGYVVTDQYDSHPERLSCFSCGHVGSGHYPTCPRRTGV